MKNKLKEAFKNFGNPQYSRNWPLKNTGNFWKDMAIALFLAPPTFLMPIVWFIMWFLEQYAYHVIYLRALGILK